MAHVQVIIVVQRGRHPGHSNIDTEPDRSKVRSAIRLQVVEPEIPLALSIGKEARGVLRARCEEPEEVPR